MEKVTYRESKIYGNGIMYVNGKMGSTSFELQFKATKSGKIYTYDLVRSTLDSSKYMVSMSNFGLNIVELNNDATFEVGQIVNHKAFGKGTIVEVNDQALVIDFAGTKKMLMTSMVSNFLI